MTLRLGVVLPTFNERKNLRGMIDRLDAALAGVGLAFLPQDLVAEHLASGRLVSLMRDWCPVFPGLHAYYPSRRQSSRALRLVIEAIRLPS